LGDEGGADEVVYGLLGGGFGEDVDVELGGKGELMGWTIGWDWEAGREDIRHTRPPRCHGRPRGW
jgi:hypothetical protein